MDAPTATETLDLVRANPSVAAALERLPALDLPQCHVTAGCLFQTVWNLRSGRPPAENIRDLDLFIYDFDLSCEAEDDAIRRVAALLADLPIRVELRNQARVHLWYEAWFGSPCAPLRSARDGIDRFLVACTSVGIAVATGNTTPRTGSATSRPGSCASTRAIPARPSSGPRRRTTSPAGPGCA